MGMGKIIAGVALVLVIIAGIVWAVHRMGAAPPPPKHPMNVYDMSANPPKLTVVDSFDWEQNSTVDAKTGYFKIHGTLYSSTMKCASCAKDIPVPPITIKRDEYKCPECGRLAYPSSEPAPGTK
jgi:hypothetical protein